LHSNIPEDFFNYREILLISLFLGVANINDTIQGLTVQELVDKMAKYHIFGDR
jgi:hypothetical protein